MFQNSSDRWLDSQKGSFARDCTTSYRNGKSSDRRKSSNFGRPWLQGMEEGWGMVCTWVFKGFIIGGAGS